MSGTPPQAAESIGGYSILRRKKLDRI